VNTAMDYKEKKWKEYEKKLETELLINLSKKFAMYFTKKCIRNKLFEASVARFKKLAQNPNHPELLCIFITYDSFIANMVSFIYI
jgi:hypothetical protein